MTANAGWQFTGTYREVPDPNNPLIWMQRSVTDATQVTQVDFTSYASTGWIYGYTPSTGLWWTSLWRGYSYTSPIFAGNDANNVFVYLNNSWISLAQALAITAPNDGAYATVGGTGIDNNNAVKMAAMLDQLMGNQELQRRSPD